MSDSLRDKLAEHGIKLQRYTGQQYVTCPQCSARRKPANQTKPCLSVKIDDDETGATWNCHHCSWSGNIPGNSGRPVQHAAKPIRRPLEPVKVWQPASMYDWFAKRGISRETVDEAEIRVERAIWFPQIEAEAPAIAFPYRRHGKLVNHKYRKVGEKLFRQDKDAERTLYGIDSLIEHDVCIWVEGEIDLLAMRETGYQQIVSLPDGAPPPPKEGAPELTQEEIARKHDRRLAPLALDADLLGKIRRHLIGTDDDEPGETLAQEIARRIGPQKCFRIRWSQRGGKDANDVLMAGGPDAVRACVDDAVPWPVSGLQEVQPGDLVTLRSARGERLFASGWKNLDGLFRWPIGRLVIITGIPGHGKSEFLDALLVHFAERYGWTFGLYSAENETVMHASALAEKHAGRPFRDYGPGFPQSMSDAELDSAERWVRRHFHWIRHDEDEPLTMDFILDSAGVLLLRYGIRALVIDPYNELEHNRGRDQSETEYVSFLLSRARRFARRHQILVFIVAHPQKPPPSAKPLVPGPYDISGGAHWFNKADIALTVHRPEPQRPLANIHAHKVKRKWWGHRGTAELWWARSTGCYFDSEEEMQEAESRAYAPLV